MARPPSTEPLEPTPAGPPTDVLDSGEAGGKAIRGGALRTGGYLAGLVLSLVSVPFMIRHLGVADYGRFVTVGSIVFIIGGISEAGLTNLGIRELAVLPVGERQRFLANLIGLRFALTATAVVLAVTVTAATGAEAAIVAGTAIAGLGLLIVLVQQTYTVPLNADLRFGWITVLELIKQGVLAALLVALVIVGAELMAFFWASVAGAAVAVAATLLLVRRYASLRPRFDFAQWGRILRETLPYALATAVGLIYFRIAIVLMSYVSTETETGLYSAAHRIVEVVGVIPWLLVSAAFPILARASRDDDERLGYALQRLFDVAALVGVGGAIALGVVAPFAVEVVAGGGFEDSVPVLRMLALAMITTFLVATWMFALVSLKLFRQILVANAVAAVVAVAGTLALSPPFGAEGAAVATVLAEGALAVACLVALRRHKGAFAPRLAVVPKVILAAGIALVPALLVPAHALILTAMSAAVYAGTALVVRAVPAELIDALLPARLRRGAAGSPP